MLHKINFQILLKTFEQDSTRYNFPPPHTTARNYDFNFRQFLALLPSFFLLNSMLLKNSELGEGADRR